MRKQFDDTKFGQIASNIIDLVWAGILFILFCVPVITAGASVCALYYCIVKTVRHERGSLTKEFLRGFRESFRVSTLVFAVILAVFVPLMFNLKLAPFYIFPAALLLPWIFPYISRFDSGFAESVKTAFLISLRNFWRTLGLDALILVFCLICYLLPFTVPVLPGVFCLGASYIIEPVLKKISSGKEDDTNEDKWYNE